MFSLTTKTLHAIKDVYSFLLFRLKKQTNVFTVLFEKKSFIYHLMNLNKNDKGYRGMTLYTYLVDYYLHIFTV